jgi:hypothetical protein
MMSLENELSLIKEKKNVNVNKDGKNERKGSFVLVNFT